MFWPVSGGLCLCLASMSSFGQWAQVVRNPWPPLRWFIFPLALLGVLKGQALRVCDAPQGKGRVGGQPFGTWAALWVPLNWVSPESETCGLGRVPANLSLLLGDATG